MELKSMDKLKILRKQLLLQPRYASIFQMKDDFMSHTLIANVKGSLIFYILLICVNIKSR